MENATRALTMAGGILLALMILGALFMMFNNLSDYQNQNDVRTKDSQIAEFNNQFEPFNKNNLTLMELKSIYNKIQSNNKKNPDNEIKTNIKTIYPSIDTQDFKSISEEDKQNRVFKCLEIKYNAEGKINEMKFDEVKKKQN